MLGCLPLSVMDGLVCLLVFLVLVRVKCPLGVVEYQWVQESELRSLGLSALCI